MHTVVIGTSEKQGQLKWLRLPVPFVQNKEILSVNTRSCQNPQNLNGKSVEKWVTLFLNIYFTFTHKRYIFIVIKR